MTLSPINFGKLCCLVYDGAGKWVKVLYSSISSFTQKDSNYYIFVVSYGSIRVPSSCYYKLQIKVLAGDTPCQESCSAETLI